VSAGLSIVILTLNEERNLPDCLASAAPCDDIVVLDSGSTDGTAEIARRAGARVVVRGFDSFAGQRNFAQGQIGFRHPWVFHLDADERLTPGLIEECAEKSREGPPLDGYFAAPRMIFQGRWIRHCTDYPAWQARFVRAPQFRFVQAGHGQREAPEMRMGRLGQDYLHLIDSDENEWMEKHRRYAREEAAAARGANTPLTTLFSSDRLARRRALKAHSRRLPCRPAARFLYQYLLRGGVLDGRPGLRYCLLLARYEGLIAGELRRAC
jgi:glycosyltransferase involved in cell wall biosynthesis